MPNMMFTFMHIIKTKITNFLFVLQKRLSHGSTLMTVNFHLIARGTLLMSAWDFLTGKW